jgi:hypothetical protein
MALHGTWAPAPYVASVPVPFSFNEPAAFSYGAGQPQFNEDGSLANADYSWQDLYGPPMRPSNMWDSRSKEHYNLPDAYTGRSTYMSSVMINLITSDEAYPVIEILPWRKSENTMTVEYDEWIFEDMLPDRVPEEAIGRMGQSFHRSRKAHLIRWGIAAMGEHEWWKTAQGMLNWRLQCEQMKNAVVENQCLQVMTACYANVPIDDNGKRTVNDKSNLTIEEFERVLDSQVDLFGIVQKQEQGFDLAVERMRQTLRAQSGRDSRYMVVPAGMNAWMRRDPFETHFLLSGRPSGPVDNPLAGKGVIRESRGYRMGDRQPDYDPAFRAVTIGQYWYNTFTHLASVPPEDYRSYMRNMRTYCEEADGWHDWVQYDMIRHCGCFNFEDEADPDPDDADHDPYALPPRGTRRRRGDYNFNPRVRIGTHGRTLVGKASSPSTKAKMTELGQQVFAKYPTLFDVFDSAGMFDFFAEAVLRKNLFAEFRTTVAPSATPLAQPTLPASHVTQVLRQSANTVFKLKTDETFKKFTTQTKEKVKELSESIKKLQQSITAFNAEKATLESHSTSIREHKVFIDQHTASLQELKTNLEHQTTKHDQLERKFQDLNARVGTIAADATNAVQVAKEARDLANNVSAAVQGFATAHQAGRLDQATKDAAQKEAQRILDLITDLTDQLRDHKTSTQETKTKADQDLVDLKQELTDGLAQKDRALQQVMGIQTTSLSEAKAEATRKLNDLQQTVDNKIQEYDASIRKHVEELKVITDSSISDIEARCDVLEASVEELRDKAKSFVDQQQYQELLDEIKQLRESLETLRKSGDTAADERESKRSDADDPSVETNQQAGDKEKPNKPTKPKRDKRNKKIKVKNPPEDTEFGKKGEDSQDQLDELDYDALFAIRPDFTPDGDTAEPEEAVIACFKKKLDAIAEQANGRKLSWETLNGESAEEYYKSAKDDLTALNDFGHVWFDFDEAGNILLIRKQRKAETGDEDCNYRDHAWDPHDTGFDKFTRALLGNVDSDKEKIMKLEQKWSRKKIVLPIENCGKKWKELFQKKRSDNRPRWYNLVHSAQQSIVKELVEKGAKFTALIEEHANKIRNMDHRLRFLADAQPVLLGHLNSVQSNDVSRSRLAVSQLFDKLIKGYETFESDSNMKQLRATVQRVLNDVLNATSTYASGLLSKFNASDKADKETIRKLLMSVDNTHFDGSFFLWLDRNNLPVPMGFLFVLPHMQYMMGSAFMCVPGSSLGNSWIGHVNWENGSDIVRKITVGSLTFYAKALIQNTKLLSHARNIFCKEYLGGNSSKCWTYTTRDTDKYQQGDISDRSVFILAVPADWKPEKDKYLDITGRYNPNIVGAIRSPSELHYPTALAYSDYWNWNHGYLNAAQWRDYFYPSITKMNTVCVRGFHVLYDVNAKNLKHVRRNLGHWGSMVGPGAALIRRGVAHRMEPHEYSNSTAVSFTF